MFELRSLCRTCGTKLDNKSSSTKLFEKSNYQLVRLIEDIADLFLEFDSSMPDHICDKCKQELDRMLAFRVKFLKVHNSLLATQKKHLQWQDNSDKEEAESVKDEPEEDEESYDLAVSLQKADDIFYEVQLDPHKQEQEDYDEEHAEGVEPAEEQDQKNSDVNPAEDLGEFEEEDEDQVIEEFRVSAKKVAKAKQTGRNAKTWVCDQCGGVFKCSTYLKLHILRHSGQKSYECDICQAKYYTENELRRHRILHTDARPYACRYCDKTFRSCSSKVIHERSHTNVRPFQCQYCEKAFTSTSMRQRHEILHSNNRKYHCETCQQWFVRPTHLALHKKTKLHKKRVAIACKDIQS